MTYLGKQSRRNEENYHHHPQEHVASLNYGWNENVSALRVVETRISVLRLYHSEFSVQSKTHNQGVRRSSAISGNCSRAASRSSTISCARTSGSGRLSDSSRLSSLSQKMSKLALS